MINPVYIITVGGIYPTIPSIQKAPTEYTDIVTLGRFWSHRLTAERYAELFLKTEEDVKIVTLVAANEVTV